MKPYIDLLERRLSSDDCLKDIKNSVDSYKQSSIEKMLIDLGYEDEKVKEFIEESKKFYDEHGDIKGTDELTRQYLEEVKNDISRSYISENKEVVFLLGLPGAGKSSSLPKISLRYGSDKKFYLIDADDFKNGRYSHEDDSVIITPLSDEKKKGIDIESLHELSSTLAKYAIEIAVSKGADIALPKVGDNYRKLRKSIRKLRRKGYKIYIHFLFTSVETALERNLKRFKAATNNDERRRLVPASYIYNVGYKPLFNFFKIIKWRKCNDYALWNGENCKPGDPVLLFEKTK